MKLEASSILYHSDETLSLTDKHGFAVSAFCSPKRLGLPKLQYEVGMIFYFSGCTNEASEAEKEVLQFPHASWDTDVSISKKQTCVPSTNSHIKSKMLLLCITSHMQ